MNKTVKLVNKMNGNVIKSESGLSKYAAKKLRNAWNDKYADTNYKVVVK